MLRAWSSIRLPSPAVRLEVLGPPSVLTMNLWVRTMPSRLIVRTIHRTEKELHFWLQFYCSKKIQIRTSQRERHRAKSRRIPNTELLLSAPKGVGKHQPSSTSLCDNTPSCQPGRSLTLQQPVSFGVLLHRHGWLNYWPGRCTQFPAPLPSPELWLIAGGSKP